MQTVTGFCAKLPLGPLDPGREGTRLTLEQIYVSLDAKSPRPATFEGQPAETRSVLAAVANQPRLVILGDPGSGKTTFLRFLALRLAQARLEPEGNWLSYLSWPVYSTGKKQEAILRAEADEPLGRVPWPHPPYVPILVVLRDFAATDFDPTSPMALWDFIRADLAGRGLADSAAAIRDMLCQGQGLFLLDGVDEVPPARHPLVWQAIGALAESVFNRCPWLTTCRLLSYVDQEAALAGAAGTLTLAPLKPAQIENFVKAWYQALLEAGQVSPTKGQLAENPMLLTIMALVQTYHGTLPQERARLYQG